jgi:serine phosphatase RsbU (regulator of sigma subunit)
VARIPQNMFVTCFYAILEPKSGTLSYANAGHNLPYLWHGGDAVELRARRMPLGLIPGMGCEEKEAVLREGDSVLFYSDGLVEALRVSPGELTSRTTSKRETSPIEATYSFKAHSSLNRRARERVRSHYDYET